ncbi:hypothetical protein K2173_010179 [Erythroxylum novogranatense]|uniref:Rho GTPase-activating protein REN1-like n=1 Tax=Erythroxylum novogranatense TaxID=1862640 RepID=A0AAV8S7H9_9ROSI|nr:hypothetical protein K2173_010179 [Erythroxylum novogranatense]
MTANKNTDSSQGDGGGAPTPSSPSWHADQPHSRNNNTVLKSGPLFLSSKGVDWMDIMEKRWFILTRTSLVFFRGDPVWSEVNLTLGGIDLNNSGSVVVKADKKLLTVLFPDGRDGRAFTLKAETMEDLYEWKTALENALAQAPNTAIVMGQNGILKNEQIDGTDGSTEKGIKGEATSKSLIIGRPVLLALEDVDGSPSFLEKALTFIEEHGTKVEGILQAADVDDVECRIQEYEQGKTEFLQGEDAHVIGDCIKYFLRELPSSPVPASCCNALLEACRTERSKRVNAMRTAICETFLNQTVGCCKVLSYKRKFSSYENDAFSACGTNYGSIAQFSLLFRILLMMQAVASNKAVNRMSTSAVAACMAPLLLRPLLAGDCEIETNIDVGGDSSIQLLKAAAAANHAQAIIITLLEEYSTIFRYANYRKVLHLLDYIRTRRSESEEAEVTDDDQYYEDDATQGSDNYTDDDLDNVSTGTYTGSDGSGEDDLSVNKVQDRDDHSSGSKSSEVDNDSRPEQKLSSSVQTMQLPHNDGKIRENFTDCSKTTYVYGQLLEDVSDETNLENKQTSHNAPECFQKLAIVENGPAQSIKHTTVWGLAPAQKNVPMESIDFPIEEEAELQKLEAAKLELQNKISEEVKGNAALQANLEQRKRAFDERRLALEQDVARLQEQLQEERDKRKALEAALSATEKPLSVPAMIDEKLKADIEEVNQTEADITKLEQKVDDLSVQLNQRHRPVNFCLPDSCKQPIDSNNQAEKPEDKQKDAAGKPTSKDISVDGAESEDKHESHLSNNHPPQNQQLDHTCSSSPNSVSTHSKKSGIKNEISANKCPNLFVLPTIGANSTASALTKLTTRLNFLKERSNQIATELQNLDKTRAPSKPALNQERWRGSEDSQSAYVPDKGVEIEGPLLPNTDKLQKSAMLPETGSQDPRIIERRK